jgi:hypothetical protein
MLPSFISMSDLRLVDSVAFIHAAHLFPTKPRRVTQQYFVEICIELGGIPRYIPFWK